MNTRKPRSSPKKIGDKFTLNCGVEVEIVELIPRTVLCVVKDSDGNTKTVYRNALGVGEVSWGDKTQSVNVGDQIELKSGVLVTVTGYKNACEVTVTDEEGNSKVTTAERFKNRTVAWNEFGRPKFHGTSKAQKVGDKFKLHCGVEVELLEYVCTSNVLIGDSSGNQKRTSMSQLRKGGISWREFGVRMKTVLDRKYKVGDRYESKKNGWYEILEVNYSDDIRIIWDDTGEEQRVSSTQIKDNYVRPPSSNWNYLGVIPDRYYVYIVISGETIAYIGKGINSRYSHVKSGTSHNYKLNQLHFSGEEVKVVIYRDDMEEEDSLELERQLILQYRPFCNIALMPV